VIRHDDADALQRALAEAGIGSRPYYRTPVHAQPPMAQWAPRVSLPATEEAARTHLAIPMSATLRPEQVAEVADAVKGAVLAAR
jgi:dTDP-3-amino-3,4,6-trideoxy-alpha-D-glucose transaminase